jgi:hypothetical protein
MGFTNVQEKKIREKNLFTGIGEVEVLCVNPSKAKIEEMLGVEINSDPNYINSKPDGTKSTRIDFWVKPVGYETLSKVTFWLDHEPYVSREKGLYHFINNQLRDTWAKSEEEVLEKLKGDMGSWFSVTGLRKAYQGELELYNFLVTLFNLDIENSEGVQFDNFKAILSGDVSEIEKYIENFKTSNDNKYRTVKVLFGVDSEGRQVIYTKGFANARQKTFKKLIDLATGQYTEFKAEWNNDTNFSIYNPEIKKEKEVANTDLF